MRQFLALLVPMSLIMGCATTPEPCTRDYFAYQSEVMQRDFVRRNRGEVRRLRTLQDDLKTEPDLFTALALVSAKRDLERVVEDLRSQVIPEARGIAAQCGIDNAFNVVMDGFLVKQGIDPQLVQALGLLELFEEPALESTLTSAR